MPKYTFLLPAYKAKYFEEALSSIKNQTFKDFLCIVSDDCSPEDLLSIYNKVCGGDDRFSYRKNEKNIGGSNLVAHWNLLVDLCKTDYFMMSGDDDIYLPTFLEEVDKLQCKYPTAGVIRARSQYIDENGEITDQDSSYQEYLNAIGFLFYRYNSFYVSGILNCVFNKVVFLRESQFTDFPVAWFSDEAAIIACSSHGICTTSNILTSMRISGINLSSQKNKNIAKLKIQAVLFFTDWLKTFIDRHCAATNLLESNQLNAVLVSSDKYSSLCILAYTDSLSFIEKIKLYRKMVAGNYLKSVRHKVRFLVLLLLGLKQ